MRSCSIVARSLSVERSSNVACNSNMERCSMKRTCSKTDNSIVDGTKTQSSRKLEVQQMSSLRTQKVRSDLIVRSSKTQRWRAPDVQQRRKRRSLNVERCSMAAHDSIGRCWSAHNCWIAHCCSNVDSSMKQAVQQSLRWPGLMRPDNSLMMPGLNVEHTLTSWRAGHVARSLKVVRKPTNSNYERILTSWMV